MIDKKNIKINCHFKDKFDIFNKIENDAITLNVAQRGVLESMIARDKSASVALGNYLFLPHCKGGDEERLVINNCILIYHLKNPMIIDGSQIKIIIALLLKANNQMEFIEKIGVAFSDEDEVKNILFNSEVTVDEIYDFVNQ